MTSTDSRKDADYQKLGPALLIWVSCWLSILRVNRPPYTDAGTSHLSIQNLHFKWPALIGTTARPFPLGNEKSFIRFNRC